MPVVGEGRRNASTPCGGIPARGLPLGRAIRQREGHVPRQEVSVTSAAESHPQTASIPILTEEPFPDTPGSPEPEWFKTAVFYEVLVRSFQDGDVVSPIPQRRREERRQPEAVDAQPLQIVEFVDEPAEVARTVAVAVLEGADEDLVEDRRLEPLRFGTSGGSSTNSTI